MPPPGLARRGQLQYRYFGGQHCCNRKQSELLSIIQVSVTNIAWQSFARMEECNWLVLLRIDRELTRERVRNLLKETWAPFTMVVDSQCILKDRSQDLASSFRRYRSTITFSGQKSGESTAEYWKSKTQWYDLVLASWPLSSRICSSGVLFSLQNALIRSASTSLLSRPMYTCRRGGGFGGAKAVPPDLLVPKTGFFFLGITTWNSDGSGWVPGSTWAALLACKSSESVRHRLTRLDDSDEVLSDRLSSTNWGGPPPVLVFLETFAKFRGLMVFLTTDFKSATSAHSVSSLFSLSKTLASISVTDREAHDLHFQWMPHEMGSPSIFTVR